MMAAAAKSHLSFPLTELCYLGVTKLFTVIQGNNNKMPGCKYKHDHSVSIIVNQILLASEAQKTLQIVSHLKPF